MRGMTRAAALLALALSAAPAAGADGTAAGKPRRIVSLNLCADELVLRLADPGQVASVTYLARDATASNVAALARGVPVNRGLAEEIAPLKPDLVIVGAFTTRATTAMLHRLGFEVMELGTAQTLDDAYAQIRRVAGRVGAPERGEAMAREMEAAFAALPPATPAHATAVVLRPNGFTAGRDSLPDRVMARAGLDNLAARLSADKFGQLTLEEIVRADPDFLIVNGGDGPPSLADDLLHHPALARFRAEGRIVSLPLRLWTCAGPELAEAAARLAAATRFPRAAPAGASPAGSSIARMSAVAMGATTTGATPSARSRREPTAAADGPPRNAPPGGAP